MLNQKQRSVQINPKPIDISFQNVCLTVSLGRFKTEYKTIIKGISGHFKSGELTAIMGPSGAGKSSLLNILSGFHEHGVSGVIRASNKIVKSKRVNGLCRKDSCYILQDDQLCPLFTVSEIMFIAANLKIGKSMTKSSKEYLIDEILEMIGLVTAKNTRCGRLSGGQKKRLSIALELIDNPPVMFLDEPTTGLDSSSCSQSVSILRSLAHGGRTVICTIHQPSASIFEMFDHVYVIAEGLCVYQGSSYNIIPYLQSIGLHCPQYHNPADFILEVVSGEYGHFVSQLSAIANDPCWRGSNAQNTVTNNTRNQIESFFDNSDPCTTPSELHRFKILVHKCLMKLFRDWTISYLKIFMHIVVGIFIGSLYSNCGVDASKSIYNAGFLIVSLVYLSYTSLMPAILKFPTELLIIKKEQFNNWYMLKTYYAAFLIVNVPIQMLLSLAYAVGAYYLSSQIPVLWRFGQFLWICMLITIISEGFGLFLGITCYPPVNGVFIGSVMICFFILFAGFVALFNHMPRVLYYVSFISYLRYGYEGLIVTIYGYNRGPLECPLSETYCHYRYPQRIFEELSMDDSQYTFDVFMLVLFVLLFFILAYIGLQRKIRSN